MSVINSLLMVVQVLSALGIIVLVLLQQGKGADMGAAFGAGSSGSVFGASGSASFLSRFTGILAAVFFSATLGLSFVAGQKRVRPAVEGGIMQSIPGGIPGAVPPAAAPAPAVPAGEATGPVNPGSPASQIPK